MNQQPIAPHVAALVKRFAGGDPVILRELIAALSADQLAGRAFLPDPLPAPPVLSAAIGSGDLDAADRRLILIATLCVTDSAAILLAAASVSIESTLKGKTADALEFGGGRFRVLDDRVRAVAIRTASRAERAEAHGALARAFRAAEQPAHALWHTVLGDPHNLRTGGAPLLALAERRVECGDFAAAFEIARTAATVLKGDLHTRARLLAAGTALWCGWTVDAEEQLQSVSVAGGNEYAYRMHKMRRALDSLRDGPGEFLRMEDRVLDDTLPLLEVAMTRADRGALNDIVELVTIFRRGDHHGADEIEARLILGTVPARSRWPWGAASGPLSPLAEAYVRLHEVTFQMEADNLPGAATTLAGIIPRLPLVLVGAGVISSLIRMIARTESVIDVTLAETFDNLRPGKRLTYELFGIPTGEFSAAASARLVGHSSSLADRAWDEPLSPREREVARMVALGRSNREIAGVLMLSVRTVEVHLASTFRKLGVRSRTELVSRALNPRQDRPL